METYILGHKFQVGIFSLEDKNNNLKTLQYLIPNLELVIGFQISLLFQLLKQRKK